MPVFMVERYLPTLGPDGVRAQARIDQAVAARASVNGALRHLRTTYSHEDELCFSFYEASSRDALVAANDGAETAYERIVEVIDVAGGTE